MVFIILLLERQQTHWVYHITCYIRESKMADVVISAPNQLRAKFNCDSGIARELWEEFAFFVPGYRYMPAFKKGWDGKARMMDLRTRTMYRGLLPKAIKWILDAGYTVEL